MPSSALFCKFSELTKKSTSTSLVLNSKIPLLIILVRTIRKVAPNKCSSLENRLREDGLISGYHTRKFIDDNVIRSRQFFENFLIKQDHNIFIALSENMVVGILCMEPAKEAGMVYLHSLHVDPGYRRLGIATSLCEKAFDIAKGKKHTGAIVIALKESLGLFTRLGFKGQALNQISYTYRLSLSFLFQPESG